MMPERDGNKTDIAYPVHNGHEAQSTEEQEPKPEENVDLLVDDVKRQDTYGVVPLHFTADTVLVKGALCHSGKDEYHRVDAILLVRFEKPQYVDTKR